MANRHLSRSVVLQTLFEWDHNRERVVDVNKILLRNAEEFAPGMGDFSFMKELLSGVLSRQKDLDILIGEAAPEWPIDKISIIDRNILRIGLFELLFSDRDEVPTKVAINEAIELAKSFGGDSSGRFVNGVLGAVYKEMGEPGKHETGKKKNKFDISYEEMPVKKLCGAVVYLQKKDDLYLALVHDVFGHWTLSKGHVKENEKLEDGVRRVVKEEMGLNVTPKELMGTNEYIAADPEKGKIRKQVIYFLAEAPSESKLEDLKLVEVGGLDDAKWFSLHEISDLNFYDDVLPIITKSVRKLLEKQKN